MNSGVPVSSETQAELSLCLLEGVGRPKPRRIAGVGAASIGLNFLLLIGITTLAGIEGTPPPPREPNPVEKSKSTPLIFPRELTQKEPNKAQVSREIHLQDLLPVPERKAQPRVFTAPPMPKTAAPQAPAPAVEPPNIRTAQASPPPVLGQAPNLPPPVVPPPQIQQQEKPKLAFETPGAPTSPPNQRNSGTGRIAPPASSVDEAVRSVARSGPGGLTVGDMPDESGMGSALGQTPVNPRQASRVELLSDPMGVDFKPYLIRVLTAVRRNWFAVIPESARLGRQGKVVVQFSINRGGGVPKLVIAMPSGTEALDRAAVAGISASNPFPPLPGEFKGDQIRVQLVFFYNVGR
jgi:TonB family protein